MSSKQRSITLDEEVDKQVQEFRWEHRISNYSKALEHLVREGLRNAIGEKRK